MDSVRIRRRKGLCIVEGQRSLSEALRTRSLLYLVVSQGRTTESGPATDPLPGADVPCYTLAQGLFGEITGVRSGTGALGVARIPDPVDPRELPARPDPSIVLFLDGIQEPGNVGGLIRTAWALGLTGVLLGKGTADPFSAKAVRASAGAVFHVPLYENMGPGEVEELAVQGFSLFVAVSSGQDYRTIRYPGRLILALGNEGAGSSQWLRRAGRPVGIPLAEGVDSLNVAVAGGIIASRMIDSV